MNLGRIKSNRLTYKNNSVNKIYTRQHNTSYVIQVITYNNGPYHQRHYDEINIDTHTHIYLNTLLMYLCSFNLQIPRKNKFLLLINFKMMLYKHLANFIMKICAKDNSLKTPPKDVACQIQLSVN